MTDKDITIQLHREKFTNEKGFALFLTERAVNVLDYCSTNGIAFRGWYSATSNENPPRPFWALMFFEHPPSSFLDFLEKNLDISKYHILRVTRRNLRLPHKCKIECLVDDKLELE